MLHPADPVSRVNLGEVLLAEIEALDLRAEDPRMAAQATALRLEARGHFECALRENASCERAHEGLSYLLRDAGNEATAAWHRRAAFQGRCVMPCGSATVGNDAMPVLHLVSARGGNLRIAELFDLQRFPITLVLPEFFDPKVSLPAHRLVWNCIGDAEIAPAGLAAAQALLAFTRAPVINAPVAVMATGRAENARRLARLPGVVAPRMAVLAREQLSGAAVAAQLARLGLDYPLLLRAPGFHNGRHFVRLERALDLPAVLSALQGRELIAMQFLNGRGTDGKFRKYRAMTIDGELYPLHLAVSSRWKVHYYSAEMSDHAGHRAEDAAFLEDMPAVVGPRAMAALHRIQATLGLEYGGIDFGLNDHGDLLLFEANATMAVTPPEAGAKWDYRRTAYHRIRAAVNQMLADRCQADGVAAAIPGAVMTADLAS
ncbi:MAG: hypothetical protein ACRD04_11325 [Terriglobales bacterium]